MGGQTFFFYGSLMDRDLLEAVLGRALDGLSFTPGWLIGFAAETADGYTFPTLVENRTARVDGIVTQGLSDADIDRITYFEDTSEYVTVVLDITTAAADIAAQVFRPTTTLKSSGDPWSLDRWRREHKPLLVAITERMMREHYGRTPIAEADAAWHRIKSEIEAMNKTPAPRKAARSPRKRNSAPHAPRRLARPQGSRG